MEAEQEEKICLFCLEPRKGRRQHKCIEFQGLFPCACIFQSHAECIIKWQIHCLDDIQCPICRVHIIAPPEEEEGFQGALIIYQPMPANREILKKICMFFGLYILAVLLLFTMLGIRL